MTTAPPVPCYAAGRGLFIGGEIMGRRKHQITAYERNELFELWVRFRNERDAAETLSDFMNGTKEEAEKLIAEFEIRYMGNTLDFCGLR